MTESGTRKYFREEVLKLKITKLVETLGWRHIAKKIKNWQLKEELGFHSVTVRGELES